MRNGRAQERRPTTNRLSNRATPPMIQHAERRTRDERNESLGTGHRSISRNECETDFRASVSQVLWGEMQECSHTEDAEERGYQVARQTRRQHPRADLGGRGAGTGKTRG